MSGRWIQNPRHGVARIEPRLAMVDAFERFLFVTPVLFTSFGFFLVGAMPVEVLIGIAASCFVGDALIAVSYLFRSCVRPLAKVTPLSASRSR